MCLIPKNFKSVSSRHIHIIFKYVYIPNFKKFKSAYISTP